MHLHPRELAGVDEDAFLFGVCRRHVLETQLSVLRADREDLADAVFLREHPVALILRRDCHDRTRAVLKEDVVRDPDLNLLSVERIRAAEPCIDALFFRLARGALNVGLLFDARTERTDLLCLVADGADLLDERMFGRECDKGHAEHGVGTRRVDGDLRIERGRGQAEFKALTASDPVGLHRLDALGPAREFVEIGEELIGIVRDLEEPLCEILLVHLGLAAPALAVLDLLVREHRTAGIAPVHGCLFLVGKAFLVEQLEQPLCPAVVVLTAGDDLAIPVVGKPQRTLLLLHVRDVRIRPLCRMHLVLDRCILGGHAEGVKPHRMQDVVPLHRAEARNHIAD